MHELCELKVSKCRTELVSIAAPYGAVRGGYLKIKGPLRRAVLMSVSKNLQDHYRGLCLIKEHSEEKTGTLVPIRFDAVENEFNTGASIKIFLLKAYSDESGFCWGLVLRELERKKFTRLGLFVPPHRGLIGRMFIPKNVDLNEVDFDEEDSSGRWYGGNFDEIEYGHEYSRLYRRWMKEFDECCRIEKIRIL